MVSTEKVVTPRSRRVAPEREWRYGEKKVVLTEKVVTLRSRRVAPERKWR